MLLSTLSSCQKGMLDTVPSSSMSGEGLLKSASTGLIPLNGIYRSMFQAGWSTAGNSHQCFGISAYNLMADVMGEDMIMASMGSGWFWFDAAYNVKTRYESKGWRSYDLWNAYFTWVSNANYILAKEKEMTGDSKQIAYIMGQAYAIRAYSYFMLAQTFARTYKGHEGEPCVPLYTEPTVPETPGKPRSTVQEVYTQIVADINKATELLKDATVVVDDKPEAINMHYSHISYDVALGLQARIALVMEDWATAKSASELAIQNSKAQIIPVEGFMGVNDVKKRNVMWGAEIIPDQSGMYAGFFTHMQGDAPYGERARKQINKLLYDKMGPKDARRAWWNPKDPANKKNGYQQVKFSFTDIAKWTGDYIWMRIEEMYLISAEANCRLGDEAKAKEQLMALMSKRDKDYDLKNVTGTALGQTSNEVTGSLLEKIIDQRRIELWGEYGRIYDLRRLKQGFRRTAEMGFPAGLLLGNRPTDNPESYMWVLTIPQSEFDGNDSLDSAKDQNPLKDML